MIKIYEWQSIPWQGRNKVVAYFKMKKSAPTKVRDIATGVSGVDDDGIRENDLKILEPYTLEQVLKFIETGKFIEEKTMTATTEPLKVEKVVKEEIKEVAKKKAPKLGAKKGKKK